MLKKYLLKYLLNATIISTTVATGLSLSACDSFDSLFSERNADAFDKAGKNVIEGKGTPIEQPELPPEKPAQKKPNSPYALMEKEFLNTELGLYSIDPKKMQTSTYDTLAENLNLAYQSGINNTFGLGIYEQQGRESWSYFGAGHGCKDSFGEPALCFYATGGTRGGIGQQKKYGFCGSKFGTGRDAVANPGDKICRDYNKQGQRVKTPWSSFNWWSGVGNNYNFVLDHFENANEHPVNRFCFEMEWPVNRLTLDASHRNTNITSDPERSQIVNINKAHKNMQAMRFEFGTYTAPRTNAQGGTIDDEIGGSYQGGGSHYYHKPSAYGSYTLDKIYMLNDRSFVACAPEIPINVRAGMRPSYAANPLTTFGGENEQGLTNALNYWNNLTRLYVRWSSNQKSLAHYPFNLVFRRFFMLYEPNDVFLMQDRGKVLSTRFAAQGDTAVHPVTLYNFAPDDRTYRLFINMGGIQPQTQLSKRFYLVEDKNNNGKEDDGEPKLTPYGKITLKANTHLNLLAIHKVDNFGKPYSATFYRHGRAMIQGSFSFQEVSRLRNTGFVIRTWQKRPQEVISDAYKKTWAKISRYPSSRIYLSADDVSAGKNFRLTLISRPEDKNKDESKRINVSVDFNYTAKSSDHAKDVLDALVKQVLAKLTASKNPEEDNLVIERDGKSVAVINTNIYGRYFQIQAISGFEQLEPLAGDWYKYREFNNEGPKNSPYLLRNTTDFKRAIEAYDQRR